MKIKATLKQTIVLLILVVISWSCSDDDDAVNVVLQPETISDIADANDDLSSLVAALDRANLFATLDGSGSFTVFAPTNAAFSSFLTANGFASLEDVPVDVLTQVLLNHVINGELASGSLTTGYANTLAINASTNENLSIFINTASGVTLNGVSNVSTPDIQATNGIIHIVDAVIGLPNIVDHALANPELSSLVGALTNNGNTTFTDLLSTPGNFTVFAPNNEAFTNFSNPNNNDLNAILSNHVIPDVTAISNQLSNSYVNTAATFSDTQNRLSLYINTDSGVTLNGVSNVILADVVATNGVIHVVNTVIDLPSVVTFALADPNFSILVQALTRNDLTTDFVSILSTPDGTDPAPFTVFAPIDQAFVDLLSELSLTALTDIDEPTLNATLTYHVVGGANVLDSNLSDGLTVSTLGGDITANVTGGATLTDANDRVSTIVATNVQASNGVIHAIDKVILPPLQ